MPVRAFIIPVFVKLTIHHEVTEMQNHKNDSSALESKKREAFKEFIRAGLMSFTLSQLRPLFDGRHDSQPDRNISSAKNIKD